MGPHLLVFVHLHMVSIFEDIACIVVNDGADEVNGGVRGRRNVSRKMHSATNAYPQLSEGGRVQSAGVGMSSSAMTQLIICPECSLN